MSIVATNTTKAQDTKLNYIKSLYNRDAIDSEKRSSYIYSADQHLMDLVNARLEKQHTQEKQNLFSSLKKHLYDRIGLMQKDTSVDCLLKGIAKKALKTQHFAERQKLFNSLKDSLTNS